MCGKRLFLALLLTCVRLGLHAQSGFQPVSYPLHVIFDTDFGPDYDDVGAITLLHAFADSGYLSILATMGSSKHDNAAPAMDVFNTYFQRTEIPIGVVRGQALTLRDKQHWTDSVIQKYPHRIRSNQDAWDAQVLYRKILAAQPDQSVTIISVGFLTNLANLLTSQPDQYSSLGGAALINRKVIRLVCMAGRFPSGNEFNLAQDVRSSKIVLTNWPTPILFSGFEIGQKIKTGIPLIRSTKIRESPVKDVFTICIPMAREDSAGRMSWDETAVLVAVKGWQNYYDLDTGACMIHEDGINEWRKEGHQQAHLVEKMPALQIQEIINQLLMHPPRAMK